MHAIRTRFSFKTRLALAGLFALGLFAITGGADAATKSSGRPALSPRAAVSKPVKTIPSNNLASRIAPLPNNATQIGRLDPGASLRNPVAAPPTFTKLPPPTFTPVAGSPPGGLVKDPGGNGAPTTLPTPSADDRNRRLGACLVGIVSACNGNVPGKGTGGSNTGGANTPPVVVLPGDKGNGGTNTGGANTGGANMGANTGASTSSGGSGSSFSPSFSFGGGGSGDATAQTAAASTGDQAAAPACVADPTDVYKRLECNLADFNGGKIDRRTFDANKADALALLDPEKLGSDLVFKVLRELVDLKLITAADREAQKRILLAKL